MFRKGEVIERAGGQRNKMETPRLNRGSVFGKPEKRA